VKYGCFQVEPREGREVFFGTDFTDDTVFQVEPQRREGREGGFWLVHFDPGGGIQDQNTQSLARD
jgi:hypothetical protein